MKTKIFLAVVLLFSLALFMPLKMTRYTLTDGQHTIVFQTMIHIANKEFYDNVERDAKMYTDDGYVFLYEGIKSGKIDIHNTADVPTFDIASYAFGLDSQATNNYFSTIRTLHNSYNADVDTDWLLAHYKQSGVKVGPGETSLSKEDLQKTKDAITAHRGLFKNIGLPFIRLMARCDTIQEYYHEYFGHQSPMMEVILIERNKVLYDDTLHTGSDKIYINYGSAHFENFYDLLKSHNSKWHIVEEKTYTAF